MDRKSFIGKTALVLGSVPILGTLFREKVSAAVRDNALVSAKDVGYQDTTVDVSLTQLNSRLTAIEEGGMGIPNFIFGSCSTYQGVYNYQIPFFWLDHTDRAFTTFIGLGSGNIISNKFVERHFTAGGYSTACQITIKEDCMFYDFADGSFSEKHIGDVISRTYAQPFCCVWG